MTTRNAQYGTSLPHLEASSPWVYTPTILGTTPTMLGTTPAMLGTKSLPHLEASGPWMGRVRAVQKPPRKGPGSLCGPPPAPRAGGPEGGACPGRGRGGPYRGRGGPYRGRAGPYRGRGGPYRGRGGPYRGRAGPYRGRGGPYRGRGGPYRGRGGPYRGRGGPYSDGGVVHGQARRLGHSTRSLLGVPLVLMVPAFVGLRTRATSPGGGGGTTQGR